MFKEIRTIYDLGLILAAFRVVDVDYNHVLAVV